MYLLRLRERTQSFLKGRCIRSETKPKSGDIVLIKDDTPRGNWRLGRLAMLMKSADGEIRSAKVQTASGHFINRPLNLLFPLEVSSDVEHKQNDKYSSSNSVTERL